MKINTKYAIGGTVFVLLVLYLLFQPEISYWLKENFGKKKVSEPQTPKPATINKNKLLKKGSKGIEVTELQRKLKASNPTVNLGNTGVNQNGIDGDFGSLTESALLLVKGVKQITLAEYDK